jgi:hypothetical protein
MKSRFIPAIILITAISGCGTMPKTAEEFRRMEPGSSFVKLEQFEVNRPFRQVAKTFRERADACLRIRVTTNSSGGYRSHPTTFKQDYLPTMRITKRRAELHIQQHIEGTNLVKVHKEPDGGYYLLVADAIPIGRNRTRIDLYRPTMGNSVLNQSIRNWATGENLGCPDLAKR